MKDHEVYAHINNGGVQFRVTDDKGPTIEVIASHFGNQTNHIKLHVSKEVLAELADMFSEASTDKYSQEYVCAAKIPQLGEINGQIVK